MHNNGVSLPAGDFVCGLFLLASVGCGTTPRADAPEAAAESGSSASSMGTTGTDSDNPGSASATTEGVGGDGTTGGPPGSASETGPEPLYDVGNMDVGAPATDGCAKIDFLFVVDNSLSMALHQTALINSFGGFINTIEAEVEGNDFHILVTDSDAGDDLLACSTCLFCGDYCDHTFDACEGELGAGEIQPYGGGASNRVCGVPAPHRYLTSAMPTPQLEETFACMAQVGTSGSGAELPMSAAVQALTTQSAPAGCNAGFRRSDAILVVTIISDDPLQSQTPDDASSVGSPQEWYDGVVSAAGDDPANVVVLGIVQTGDSATPRFDEFFELLGERALREDVNAPSYEAFFDEAVALIDVTCDAFEPEG